MDEEEPDETDEAKAEFDRLAKDAMDDTYRIIGKCITAWSQSEGNLVYIAAMLLDSSEPEKIGLILYSVNFNAWLSIISELFAIDPKFAPLRPHWLKIESRLSKLNDTRVALAHHALGPGKGFEHFVESAEDDFSSIFPFLRPNKSDARTKWKKRTPIGMEELSAFIEGLAETTDKVDGLIELMTPIYLEDRQKLAAKISELRTKISDYVARNRNVPK